MDIHSLGVQLVLLLVLVSGVAAAFDNGLLPGSAAWAKAAPWVIGGAIFAAAGLTWHASAAHADQPKHMAAALRVATTDEDPSGTFHGYACTQDCSGHRAGYAWAERKGVVDEDDCSGNSESFIEGCKAYVDEEDDAMDAQPHEEWEKPSDY